MPRLASLLAALALGLATGAHAGPDDPSKFDPVQYAPQKALYDFNFAKPGDGRVAFGYIRNHLEAIRK